MKKILLVVAALMTSTAVADDDMKAAVDAFAKTFVGTWVNEDTLDSDLLGIAKKGDKIVAQLTYTKKDGFIMVDWRAEINGKPSPAVGKGLMGWDATRKRLRMRWFTTSGANGTNTHIQRGKRWVTQGNSVGPDGVKSSARTVIQIKDDNTHVRVVTDRKKGDEKLADQKKTWTRKK